MLRESSSHMAILGRKEVHCGKGRVPCAELLQVLAVPSHLEEDGTLSQNTLQLESSGALHSPLLCIFLNIHPFHTQPDKKSCFFFSSFCSLKFKQASEAQTHRIPHCWFLIKVYPRNTHPTKAFDCSTVPAPVDAPGMSQLMVWPEKEERSKATADSETEEVATASVILCNLRGRGVASIATGC